jgi:hypothetical protein
VTRHPIRRWCGNALAVGRLLPAYLALGALKHVVPVQTLARWVWRHPTRVADHRAIDTAVACVWRTRGLLRLGDRDCLQRSLLLYRELSGLGADPTLMIGFRQSANKVQGHAWVIAHEEVVAEPTEIAEFVPTFSFGRRGELVRARGETAST